MKQPPSFDSLNQAMPYAGNAQKRESVSLLQVPQISLPKGGGAIRRIDEKFSVNAANGTSVLHIPLPFSEARGFLPALSLSYNSGNGNGLFGLGWSLQLPVIRRKTEQELPQYQDATDSDTYIFPEAEDLVPEFKTDAAGNLLTGADGNYIYQEIEITLLGIQYLVRSYKPRIEGSFSRIERWTEKNTGILHWRVISRENTTTIYGRNPAARISDPADSRKTFEWLPEMMYNARGNCVVYEYKPEDASGVDHAKLHNKNRLNGNTSFSNTYLKRIRYGNITPYLGPEQALPDTFLFETVFDYGEHDQVTIPYLEVNTWNFRPDAFSSYRSGFEIRTCRLCKRVLLFHHIDELPGGSALVQSLNLGYSSNGAEGFTFLTEATLTGFTRHDDGSYTQKSFPPLSFEYQPLEWNTQVETIPAEALAHVPAGIGPESNRYQWVDLYSEGLTGLLAEQAGAWFYQSNLGNGRFAPAVPVMPKPSFNGLNGEVQLLEMEADGIKQVAQWQTEPRGFFELDPESQWQPFKAFESVPTIDFAAENTRLLDLDGDGLADLLITEQEVFTWYASKGKKGFYPANRLYTSTNEENGPALVFSDPTQSIFLADMSGDGLTDIVRIRNGEVCYWPNLGYGRFGTKVAMDDAPIFDRPGQFDPARIQLADMDGSGTTDIVYTGKNQLRIWLNQQGNSFFPEPKVFSDFPEIDQLTQITITDLLGTGTACLIWRSTLPAHSHPMRYIDLMGSKKPHLLTRFKNNIGKEVRLHYKSSTGFYTADKLAGQPWVSKLPFPVQVVAKVETFDRIRKTRYASEYTYHHGYYDSKEREFRGFGRVDQKDTEEIAHYVRQEAGGQVLAQNLHQPPVLTRLWYHTGAFTGREHFLQRFTNEYFQNSSFTENHLSEPELPQELSAGEYREAVRACKGRLLRKEIYALDDDPIQQQLPYTVEQYNCLVKRLQPAGKNKFAVFYAQESEGIVYQYERNPQDPSVAHSFVLETDRFGNVLQQASVVYGRLPAAQNMPEQEAMHVLLTENTFTQAVSEAFKYHTPLSHEARTFEITGLARPLGYFTISQLRTDCRTASFIDYHQTPSSGIVQKKQLSFIRHQYRSDDGTTVLPFGKIESRGLLHQSYQAAFTPGLLGAVFDVKMPLASLQALLTDAEKGGYILADNYFWTSSGSFTYDPAHFFLPVAFINPFGKRTKIAYDSKYFLFVEKITDALNNENTVMGFNYRVLSPYLMQDMNDNLSAVRYDELGRVIKGFSIGKKGTDQGDEFDATKVETKDALDFPSTEMAYNLHAWYQQTQFPGFDLSAYKPQPPVVKTSIRETHYYAHPQHESLFQESYAFLDGEGKPVLTKVQAEPGPALQVQADGSVTHIPDTAPNLRWIGTGRTVLNNKANPVKQYEPYFSVSPVFDDEKEMVELGVTPVIYYDPLGRVIRMDLPDKTFGRIEFTPWLQKNFDANDTVKESDWYAALGSPDPAAPEPASPLVRAAWLAASHADTPTISHLDSLGRKFLTVVSDGKEEITQKVVYDSSGNRLQEIDGLNRVVMAFTYDMQGNPLRQVNMDAGTRWIIPDAARKPLLSWDERNQQFSYSYDALGRLVDTIIRQGSQPEVVFGKNEYGESLPPAAAKAANLRNQLYRSFDQAGIQTHLAYDFKGNLLRQSRQLGSDYKHALDWTDMGNVNLEVEVFESSTAYDALNRPVRLISPHTNSLPAHELITGYTREGLLGTITCKFRGESVFTSFVSAIRYNARKDREEIVYGNQTRTTYRYDAATFRLTHLQTTRNNGDILQDLHYTFDPAGNITQLQEQAQPAVIFDGENVEAQNTFAYDALYRLTKATGRKHAGQTEVNHAAVDSNYRNHPFIPSAVINPNEAGAFRNYEEQYTYDKAGNLAEQKHISKNSHWTRTNRYQTTSNRLVETSVGTNFSFKYIDEPNGINYDAHGNMSRMEHIQQIIWDSLDRLKEADLGGGGKAFYVYDAQGKRVRKVIERQGGKILDRIYLNGLEIYRENDQSGQITLARESLHVMDDSRRIAMVDTTLPGTQPASRLIRYQYSNHLQSASLELDETARIISYEEYFPFGTTSYYTIDATREVPARRYRYTGKERDEETGLNYHGSRYYAPWLCRWTSADPSGIEDGLNLYAYVHNNPVSRIDPDGRETKTVEKQDNFKQLLREAIQESENRSVTDEYLKKQLPGYLKSYENKFPGFSSETATSKTFKFYMDISGRTTVKLKDFSPPGWESATNPEACFQLACAGVSDTIKAGENPTSGGGVILYESEARRIKTDKVASNLALEQIQRHIDSGRAVVAGVNEPATSGVIDAKKQPVTDHFVAIYGYEKDIQGNIKALLAKDNAIAKTGEVRFYVMPDGSITKPVEKRPKGEEYLAMEYQLSEIRFNSSLPYTGSLEPTNDKNAIMYWPNKKKEEKK